MEIASTSPGNGLFDFPYRVEDFPVVEYIEDGTIKAKFFPQPVIDRNLYINPITTIQNIFNEIIVKKKQSKAVDFLQSLKRSYFSVFDNTVENDGIYEGLSVNIKDYSEQLEEINEFFCFNKTEWSKIFTVSRVTIYDWLNGKTTPTGDNASKISSIYKLLSTISGKGNTISRTYLHQNISKYNKSLMGIFLSSQDIVGEYQDLNETITAMMNHSGRNKERLVKLAKSKRPKDEILDYNLKNLNY